MLTAAFFCALGGRNPSTPVESAAERQSRPGISSARGYSDNSPPISRAPMGPPQTFKFPPDLPPASPMSNGDSSPIPPESAQHSLPLPGKSTTKEASTGPVPPQIPQLTRILSTSSQAGSHRSSVDFNSVSGNSTETLASEYTSYSPAWRPNYPRHMRNISLDSPATSPNSQSLLMGYAQISASFTVDGSLVNQDAFEEVKRNAVVGVPGGSFGAPGNGDYSAGRGKARKGSSGGLLGALGLNNIEESISGLLSRNNLDGLRDMRGVSSSRSIPLLTTSQSLLFVDLRLAPGEEQSYSFTFTLPKGLPASHKGKAIKIFYNLIIGTQRPSTSSEPQRVNRISIPFRVFSGVNGEKPPHL